MVKLSGGICRCCLGYARIDAQWQWVNDDNRWADFPPDINQLLTDSKRKQLPSVDFSLSDEAPQHYIVDFKKKLQMNSKTKNKREIRCIPVYRRGEDNN